MQERIVVCREKCIATTNSFSARVSYSNFGQVLVGSQVDPTTEIAKHWPHAQEDGVCKTVTCKSLARQNTPYGTSVHEFGDGPI
eukprot:COSAG02_NODE_2213_length_9490_cov_2.784155_4_plen_84_part_00